MSACYNIADETLIYQHCFEKQRCRSFLECCMLCNLNSTCLGVMKGGAKEFYVHKACSYLEYAETCAGASSQIHLKYKPMSCGDGGSFNVLTKKCDCKLGWSGATCNTAPQDCTALIKLSYTIGSYWIDTVSGPGGSLKPVFCELTSASAFRLYVFRNDGRTDHNKTWAEYESGYKIDDNNFWLGLDTMSSYANSAGKNLKMVAVFQNDVVTASWGNSGVIVYNKTFKYQLTHSSSSSSGKAKSPYSVNITGCLSSGFKFSTWDSDNDANSNVNLASTAGAGWYFESSISCNPLGRLRSVLQVGETEAEIRLPSLDMVNGGFDIYFQYVSMYFE